MYEVDRGIVVRSLQRDAMAIGPRIGLVDPVYEGLSVSDNEKIAVEHGNETAGK